MTDWKSALRADPTSWLVDNASPPIRYRVLSEILSQPEDDPKVVAARKDAMTYPPATKLARGQRADGTWAGTIHVGDARKPAASTELALCLLSEYGFDRSSPPMKRAVKLLKSFLTQKRELKLYEFQRHVKADILRERYYRFFLRVLALGLVQRTGSESEGKVMDAVLDLLNRVSFFVNDPIARRPVDRTGSKIGQIRREAMRDGYLFVPDLHTLEVFCSTPRLLDSDVLKNKLKKIHDYVITEMYQSLGAPIGTIKTARGSFVKGWGIELRPVEHYLKTGNLDYLLHVLEGFARLGLVNRYPLLMSYVEWLVGQQEKDGRWNINQKHFDSGSLWARTMRLEKDWRSPLRASADMTFRILLILRYQWERQIRMLDRGEDPYAL